MSERFDTEHAFKFFMVSGNWQIERTSLLSVNRSSSTRIDALRITVGLMVYIRCPEFFTTCLFSVAEKSPASYEGAGKPYTWIKVTFATWSPATMLKSSSRCREWWYSQIRRLLLFDALTTLQVFVSQLRWPFIVEWNTGWVHELNSFLEKRQLLTFGWFWQDNRYKASPERWVLPMSCRSVEGSVEMVWYLLHIFAFVIQLSRVVSKLQESTSFAKSNLLCSSR